MHDKKIRFQNLSTPLKIAIITAWIYTCVLAISFVSGIFLGALE